MKILKPITFRKPRIISQKKVLRSKLSKVKKSPWYKAKKNYVSFRQRLVLAKKNPNKKRYYLFFSKKRNNVFLTITDVIGRVVVSQSAGSCKITTKKKKISKKNKKSIAKYDKNKTRKKKIKIKRKVKNKKKKKIYKIIKKKKKRSPDTLKTVSASVAKIARAKNIKYLFKFFMNTNQTKIGKTIFESFKKTGLFILQGVVVKNKSHGLLMRKKKAKRL